MRKSITVLILCVHVCVCVCVYLLPTGCSKGLYYKLNIHCICRLYANMQLIDFGSFKELQHFFVH